jgi:hypothetical protein
MDGDGRRARQVAGLNRIGRAGHASQLIVENPCRSGIPGWTCVVLNERIRWVAVWPAL